MHTERELKFAADRNALKTALILPLPGEVIQSPLSQALKSTYFDTKALELMRRGVLSARAPIGGEALFGHQERFSCPRRILRA